MKNIRKKTIIILIMFVIFLLIGRLLFPYNEEYPYFWVTSTISRIGWIDQNPYGWIFFYISFIIIGFGLIPLSFYYFLKIKYINKNQSIILFILLILGNISELLLGLIPSFNELTLKIHGINAIILFISSYLSSILLIYFYNKIIDINKKILIGLILLWLYGFISLIFIVIVTPEGDGRYYFDFNRTIFEGVPFWEWQSFIIMKILLISPLFIKKIKK